MLRNASLARSPSRGIKPEDPMVNAGFLAAVLAIAAQPSAEKQNDTQDGRAAAWQALFDRTAEAYEIYRDHEHAQRLQLHTAPIYKWKAASANDGVFGAVYVWTYQGCAENVACFWRSLEGRGTLLKHEIHSLSPAVLDAVGASTQPWKPTAGLRRKPLEPAPAPAGKAPARLAQMRRLAGAFSGYTQSRDGVRRELRLLPAPLYRYESTGGEVFDGAVFGFVCTVGTDPEAFLVLESRHTTDGQSWQYALARFSSADTFISFQEKPVWKSLRGLDDTIYHSADYTYTLFGEPLAAEPEVPATADVPRNDASQ
jgi:hypothetical protein